ncbi:bifunctional UDP-N-acetylglucosamine diphosphorylase/glucosamine-1-phosphate N-acetyltransferase GlmU [bacterium]|nr:bifunctional UDP-N-acetylglucosamine diphosphorylase/glucosamine-1-phosphate N-acetyltransferase GlmU [bacterium]
MNKNMHAIILAAGKATRFKTGRTKLLEKICGQEMVLYSTKMLAYLQIESTVVVGHQKEKIKKIVSDHHKDTISFAHQEEQKGTGHAVLCTRDKWNKDNILVLNGDMPLVSPQVIKKLYKTHQGKKAAISFVVSHLEHPGHAYGRVIQEKNSVKIVEAKDFTGDPTKHCWINAGIYLINKKFLQESIDQLKTDNANQEFYLTDLVGIASDNKKTVATIPAPFDLVRGINTLEELWATEEVQRAHLIRYWMQNGVRFVKAQNIHLDITVKIGAGSIIGGGVYLLGNTIVGNNCNIQEYTRLENATIGDNSTIKSHTVINDSILYENVSVGPFAHLRNGTVVEQNAKIGNFVEVKKSFIGNKTKAKHLAYLGDATIGKQVNIGAGTIICNHNGISKEKTIIEDNVYIGSNNTLVAPLTIEKNSFTAAGSTITKNVPANSLAIARAYQVNKEGYAPLLKKKIKKKSNQPKNESII